MNLSFILHSRKDIGRICDYLYGLAGSYEIVVKPYVENRRRRQENLYRKWCRVVAAETGNDPEHIHKYFARKFLGEERHIVRFEYKGKVIEREVDDIRSTTSLSVKEMTEYMTQVHEFILSTLSIDLPEAE